MEGKNCLILAPHFDDEIFLAAPFLMNPEWDNIMAAFFNPGDFIPFEVFVQEKAMAEDLSKKQGYFFRIMQGEPMHVLHWLESIVEDWGSIDYFITTDNTGHPTHRECYYTALQLKRFPWCNKIRNFLVRPPLSLLEGNWTWDTLCQPSMEQLTSMMEVYEDKVDRGYADKFTLEMLAFGGMRYRTVWRTIT